MKERFWRRHVTPTSHAPHPPHPQVKERFWRRDAALAGESDDEGEEGEEGDGEGGAADEGDGMVEYSDEGEGGDADLRRPWELGRLSQGQIDAMLSSESQRLLRAQKGQLPCTNEKSIALGDVLSKIQERQASAAEAAEAAAAEAAAAAAAEAGTAGGEAAAGARRAEREDARSAAAPERLDLPGSGVRQRAEGGDVAAAVRRRTNGEARERGSARGDDGWAEEPGGLAGLFRALVRQSGYEAMVRGAEGEPAPRP